jgi:hypothetical protein
LTASPLPRMLACVAEWIYFRHPPQENVAMAERACRS